MKRILQRKFMLVFWLATILMSNLTAIAQTSVIDGGPGWTNPVGEVTAETYDQATNYTTYEIRCIRGFGIKSFTIDNTLNSLTRISEDDDYHIIHVLTQEMRQRVVMFILQILL